VILLDTHIWIWWVHEDERLPGKLVEFIESRIDEGLGISVVSCWEVAKLVERRRIDLPKPVTEWIRDALAYPGIRLVGLTPEIAIEATQLPQPFHRDPADQFLVATARILETKLVTLDGLILGYPHVPLAKP
jgi:PIN domain nuclease of toxin-antitoxin system